MRGPLVQLDRIGVEIELSDRVLVSDMPCDWPGCALPTPHVAWVVYDPDTRRRHEKLPWKGVNYATRHQRMICVCPQHRTSDHVIKLYQAFITDPSPRCARCSRLTWEACVACGMCVRCGCRLESCPRLQGVSIVPPPEVEHLMRQVGLLQ